MTYRQLIDKRDCLITEVDVPRHPDRPLPPQLIRYRGTIYVYDTHFAVYREAEDPVEIISVDRELTSGG